MAEAIEDFFLTGALRIQEVVDEAVGAALRHGYRPDETDDEVADDETGSKAAIKRFWGMIGHAALVASMGVNLLALGQSAYSGFAGQPHTPPAIENTIKVEMPGSGAIVVDQGSGTSMITVPNAEQHQ
jgi:hypothetical protein